MPKILIVEDEKILGKIYRDYLKKAGFATQLEPTTRVGDDFVPDLILLDHGLPEEEDDGIEAIPRLKKKFPKSKVVVFSNYSVFDLRQRAIDAGADDYWVKVDLSLKNLLANVQNLVGN